VIRFTRRPTNPKLAELRRLPIFAGLSASALRSLAANLDEVTVMREGRGNDTFWIILDGEVALTVGGRVHEKLGPGDVFGLPSMFTRKESMADVVARSPVRALVASHGQFNSLVADSEVEIRFKAAMFDRLRDEVFQLTKRRRAAPRKTPT